MAYNGAVDTLDYGEKRKKKDGEFQEARNDSANENSPFAWTQGKAPVGRVEGAAGGVGNRVYVPPNASPDGPPQYTGAVVSTPSSTGPGSQFKATGKTSDGKSFGVGDYPADPFSNAVRTQRGGANENLGPMSMDEHEMDLRKKQADEHLANAIGRMPLGASADLGLS